VAIASEGLDDPRGVDVQQLANRLHTESSNVFSASEHGETGGRHPANAFGGRDEIPEAFD
jgi:hypothetical protein